MHKRHTINFAIEKQTKEKYNIVMKPEIKAIIAQKTLLTIITLFTNSFFIAHLVSIAPENIVPVAVFNISYVFSLTIACLLLTRFLKCGRALLLHRLGIFGHAAFLFALMGLKENVMPYLVPLGIFFGFATEAWWLPIHIFIARQVSKPGQPKFQGYLNAACGAAAIAAPLALGTVIQAKSFEQTALAVAGITGLMFILSFFLVPQKNTQSTYQLHALPKPRTMPGFFARSLHNKTIFNIYITNFLRGTYSNGALNVVVVIYAAYLFGSGLNLGIFLSAFAIIAILAHAVFGHFARYRHFTALMFFVAVFTCAVAVAFVWIPSVSSFLSYQFCFTALVPLISTVNNINFYNMSNQKDIKTQMPEFLQANETVLNSGRLTGFLLMFLLIQGNPANLKTLLFILTLCAAASGIFALEANRRQQAKNI